MKHAIILMVAIFAITGVVLADDYIRIDVDSIPAGSDSVTINFMILRECPTPAMIAGVSNGFVMTATGCTWTFNSFTASADAEAWFPTMGMGFQFTDGMTGTSNSGWFGTGGIGGMPVVDNEVLYFTLNLDISDDVGEIYIDSAFFAPSGAWKFSGLTCGQGGDPDRPLFVDKDGSDANHPICIKVYDACIAPTITNCPFPDTLQTDNCGAFTYQFNADPPGANIYWEHDPFTNGQIDSATGIFTFSTGFPSVNGAEIFAINADCNPPLVDTCGFFIGSDLLKLPLKSVLTSLFPTPSDREMYVFGPEGAESVAVWIKIEGSTAELTEMGVVFRKTRENVVVAKIRVEDYFIIQDIKGVIYISPQNRMNKANTKYTFNNTLSPDLDVSAGYFFADSARSLYGVDGSGVIIGIIDKEMDPTRADFYFDHGDSKILYFWDMDANSGGGSPPGSPYNKGLEWTKSDFDVLPNPNYSQVDTTLDSKQEYGHGTLVAGIAAGTGWNPADTTHDSVYVGVAPGANLILVSLPSDTAFIPDDVLLAMEYIREIAEYESKPCVVNISRSFNPNGPRDGSSEIERDITNVLVEASIFNDSAFMCVVAAGNEGWVGTNPEAQNHYEQYIKARSHASGSGPGSFELYIPTVPYNGLHNPDDTLERFRIAVWYDGPYNSIRVISPSDTTDWVPTYSSAASVCGDAINMLYLDDGFGGYRVRNEIWSDPTVPDPFPHRNHKYCDIYFSDLSLYSFDYHIPNGVWRVELSGDPGNWDAYIYASESTISPYCARMNYSDYDINHTITEPGCVEDVITVASVNTKNSWTSVYTGNVPASNAEFDSSGFQLGDVSFFSSRGGSRVNPDKPEAFAPGAWVASARHEAIREWPGPGLFRFGVDTSHIHFTGTSLSAPHVAGAIALALEADPELTVGDIKTMISSVPTVDGNCFNAVEFMHLVASPDCRPGDANGDEMVDIDDIIFLINYIFGGASSPYPYCCGDADGSCSIDIDDVVYLITYIFGGGPEPVPACYTCEYPVK